MQRLEILNTQSKPFSDNQASRSRGGGQDVGGVGGGGWASSTCWLERAFVSLC